MRRSVFIGSLAATLVLGVGALSQRRFELRVQQKPETAEVKIDNFSFGPAALTVRWEPRLPGPIATIYPTRW
jgi:hypothetical protein